MSIGPVIPEILDFDYSKLITSNPAKHSLFRWTRNARSYRSNTGIFAPLVLWRCTVGVQSVTYRYREFPVQGIFHFFVGIGTGIGKK